MGRATLYIAPAPADDTHEDHPDLKIAYLDPDNPVPTPLPEATWDPGGPGDAKAFPIGIQNIGPQQYSGVVPFVEFGGQSPEGVLVSFDPPAVDLLPAGQRGDKAKLTMRVVLPPTGEPVYPFSITLIV